MVLGMVMVVCVRYLVGVVLGVRHCQRSNSSNSCARGCVCASQVRWVVIVVVGVFRRHHRLKGGGCLREAECERHGAMWIVCVALCCVVLKSMLIFLLHSEPTGLCLHGVCPCVGELP